MEQAEARRLARVLSENTGTVHIATTDTALHGQWPAAVEVWVILPVGAYPWTRVIRTEQQATDKIEKIHRNK